MKQFKINLHSLLNPHQIHPVLISGRGWVDLRATVRPERLCQREIPTTLLGIEPTILQLVAQCLNQMRHHVPHSFTIPLSFQLCGYFLKTALQIIVISKNSQWTWCEHVTHTVQLYFFLVYLVPRGWMKYNPWARSSPWKFFHAVIHDGRKLTNTACSYRVP
jgi:hypothetical protein